MKNKNALGTTILIVVAVIVLFIVFAWGKTGTNNKKADDTAANNQVTTDQTQPTDTGDAGKLGPNEVQITAANFDTLVVQGSAGKLVKLEVVDAYAPWCPHCQKMGQITTTLSNEFAGKVTFGKMNSDNQDPSVKANFDFAVNKGLQGYPTFWFYKDGKQVYSFSGEETQDQFKADIQKYQ